MNVENFKTWCKLAYPEIKPYNIKTDNYEGEIMKLKDGDKEIILIGQDKIIAKYDNENYKALDDKEIQEVCEENWGKPKVKFPKYKITQQDLEWNGQEELVSVITRVLQNSNITRNHVLGKTMIKLENSTLVISKLSVSWKNKYYPLTHKNEINNIIKTLELSE